MKKRKELDALLMNGKKSRPKRTKDGHELLQNMDSDTNSSDIDEFIMQPRKQTFVRRRFAVCSICIRLLFFMLVVACIAISCGVMWMHFELKNDLDELRDQLKAVTLSAEESSIPDEVIESLQQKVKVLPGLVTNYGTMNETLKTFNNSILQFRSDLEAVGDLTKSTHDLEASLSQAREQLVKLQNKVSELETTVQELSSVTPSPPKIVTAKPEELPTPVQTANEEITGVVLGLQKSVETLDRSLEDLNSTVVRLSSEVGVVRAQTQSTDDGASSPQQQLQENYASLLSQLQLNVTYLMQQHIMAPDAGPGPTSAGPGPTSAGPGPTISADWKQQMTDKISVLEIEVKNLNPEDLNNNLLNNDTAKGFQTILENTYREFRDEIADTIRLLQNQEAELNRTVLGRTTDQAELTARVDRLELKVDNLPATHGADMDEVAVLSTKKTPAVTPATVLPDIITSHVEGTTAESPSSETIEEAGPEVVGNNNSTTEPGP